jgi:hypothetical protein
MSQRSSGFDRIPADLYETPAWAVAALAEHINLDRLSVWEPSCGSGKMVRALEAHGADVFATDVLDQGFADMAQLFDFVSPSSPILAYFDSIIGNPPYGPGGRLAVRFIENGLERLPPGGVMAMLLQADFDSAGGRRAIFRDCPHFAGSVVLNKRIVWFEPEPRADGKPPSGPSQNHTWFIWQRRILRPSAPPFRVYAPSPDQEAA